MEEEEVEEAVERSYFCKTFQLAPPLMYPRPPERDSPGGFFLGRLKPPKTNKSQENRCNCNWLAETLLTGLTPASSMLEQRDFKRVWLSFYPECLGSSRAPPPSPSSPPPPPAVSSRKPVHLFSASSPGRQSFRPAKSISSTPSPPEAAKATRRPKFIIRSYIIVVGASRNYNHPRRLQLRNSTRALGNKRKLLRLISPSAGWLLARFPDGRGFSSNPRLFHLSIYRPPPLQTSIAQHSSRGRDR